MENKNKKSLSVLIGAAFLMATSAIGPGIPHTDRNIYREPEGKLRIRYSDLSYLISDCSA